MISKAIIERVTIWQVLAIALILRTIWAFIIPIHPISDSSIYDLLARRLADGHGYSWADGSFTAYWPVGTSTLYAIVYKIFGHGMSAVAVVNVLLGTLLVAATYALASREFSKANALLASALMAIWPTWIAFTTIISSELPTNICLIFGVYCALQKRWPAWKRTISSTIFLVGATYFRANMLPFIIVLPLLMAIRHRRAKLFLTQGSLALLVAVLLIAPWGARNYHVFGKVVPISTNFGVNLWIGNSPKADGGFMEPADPGLPTLSKNEVLRDKIYGDLAKEYIINNPMRYVTLSLNRARIALDRETYGVGWNAGLSDSARGPLKLIMSSYWYLILISSIVGLLLYLRKDIGNILSPVVVVPIAAMAPPILIMSTERYHYAMAPFIAIFAAYLLERWLRRRDCNAAESQISDVAHS